MMHSRPRRSPRGVCRLLSSPFLPSSGPWPAESSRRCPWPVSPPVKGWSVAHCHVLPLGFTWAHCSVLHPEASGLCSKAGSPPPPRGRPPLDGDGSDWAIHQMRAGLTAGLRVRAGGALEGVGGSPDTVQGPVGAVHPCPTADAGVMVTARRDVHLPSLNCVQSCLLGTRYFFFFSFSLRAAGGHRWQDSINRRRLTLNRRRLALNRRQLVANRRRLADEQPPLLAGWRSAEARVSRRPAVFAFLSLKDRPDCVAARGT